METVAELERAIARLPQKDFEVLVAWVEKRARTLKVPGRDEPLRDHSAFLNSYTAEDEGLYDDAAAG